MKNNKEELEIKENGATQTKVAEGYEYIPVPALEALARTMKYGGEKYGRKNHLKISCEENLGRAVRHVYKYLDGDTSEEHLDHAISRMAMAIDSKAHENDFNNPIVVENQKDDNALISIKIDDTDIFKYNINDTFIIVDIMNNIVGSFKFNTSFNLGKDFYVNCDFINPSLYNANDFILKPQGKCVYKILKGDDCDNFNENDINNYEYKLYREKPIYIPTYAFNVLKHSKFNVIKLKKETVGRIYDFENDSQGITWAQFRLKSDIDLSKYVIEFAYHDKECDVCVFNIISCDTRTDDTQENSDIIYREIIKVQNSKYVNTLPYSPNVGILKNEILFNGEKLGKITEISIKNKDDEYAYAVCELNRDIEIYHLSFLKLNYIKNNIFTYELMPNIIDMTSNNINTARKLKFTNIKVDRIPHSQDFINDNLVRYHEEDNSLIYRNPKYYVIFEDDRIGEVEDFYISQPNGHNVCKRCDIRLYDEKRYKYFLDNNIKFELKFDSLNGNNYFYNLISIL